MSRRPWFPLYVADFTTETAHLTAEEIGAFTLLLASIWRNSGSVPNDDKDLRRVTHVARQRWPRVKARIMPLLVLDDDDRISHAGLSEVLDRLASPGSRRRINAQNRSPTSGGHPKKFNGLASADFRLQTPDTVYEDIHSSVDVKSTPLCAGKKQIWSDGLRILKWLSEEIDSRSLADKRARNLIGKWVRNYPTADVRAALKAASEDCCHNVIGFIEKWLDDHGHFYSLAEKKAMR
jgi:uncharacterized protein YdaU (DUF1376 family)